MAYTKDITDPRGEKPKKRGNFEEPEIRTGKAPRHQAAASKYFDPRRRYVDGRATW